MRRRKTDLTPTFGIAIAALTAYVVYMSLKMDKLVQQRTEDKTTQKKNDEAAAKDRAAIRVKSDLRNKQIGWALAVLALLAGLAQIKGFPWV